MTTMTRVPLEQRITESGLRAVSRYVGQGEWQMSAPERPVVFDKWRVTLLLDSRAITVPMEMGVGYEQRPPTAAEVMEAVLSDVASYLNAGGFEDWASEFGYDTDSRAAESIYRACESLSGRLAYLLADKTEEWLWQTER